MSLLEKWRSKAYDQNADSGAIKKLWDNYFKEEEEVYKQLLSAPDIEIKGSVKELADKYNMDVISFAGFLDGINDSLKRQNPIETMDEGTIVSLEFDKEKLYKNMVEAKADWLYGLKEWEPIFDKDTRDRLYKEQKRSHTVVNTEKIGRNDICPCGSGKKYKYCCGKK